MQSINKLLAAACLAVAIASAQPNLDLTFGVAGKVVTDFGASEFAIASAVLPDGKILVLGSSYNGSPADVLLVRYLPDGAIDPSFGNAGKVIADFGGNDFPNGLAVLPDGRFVISGHTAGVGEPELLVARFQANGQPDTTFNGTGYATLALPDAGVYGRKVALVPGGGIAVVANVFGAIPENIAVVQFTATGQLDTSFDSDGIALHAVNGTAFGILRQSTGNFVIFGRTGPGDYLAFRVTASGAPDPSFGYAGIVTADFGAEEAALDGVLQPDDKIVLAGTGGGNSGVVRLNANGAFDATFGNNGIQVVPLSALRPDGATAIALQSDGKILIGGSAQEPGVTDNFGTARLLPNGSFDPSFGAAGIAITEFGGISHQVTSLGIQPGNRIVAAGYRLTSDFTLDIAMCRYGCGDLRAMVNALLLDAGRKNSLLSKVDAAQKAIAADRPSAPNILGALIQEVLAYRNTGILETAPADALIAAAQCVMAGL